MIQVDILKLLVILGCIGPTALNAQEMIVLSGGENHPQTSLSQNILSEAYRRIGIQIEKNKTLVPKITAALQEMEKEGLIQAFNNMASTD